jgi:signal transduction histidine kinase
MSCSKSEQTRQPSIQKDNISYYINKASDIRVPYKKRLVYNQKAQELLLTQENDSINSDNLIKVATNFYRLNSWQSLKTISQKGLARSIDREDEYFIGQSYRWLGIYYENISVNDSAFYCYSNAEKIFKKLNSESRLCDILQDKAQVQYYVNDYLAAESSLIKALKIANKLNLSYQKICILTSLGLNSSHQADYVRGFSYLSKALFLTKEKKVHLYQNSEVRCLNNIALNYINRKDFNKARLSALESLRKNIESNLIKFPQDYCTSLDLLGIIKLKSKDYKGIDNLFLKTSRIRDSLNIEFEKNFNKLNLSEYYQATNQISKAQQFAHEAYSLSKSYRNAGDMLQCLKQLAKVEPQNALKYSQEYIRISDSMHQLERQTRNKFAKIAFETEEITTEKEQAIQQKWIFFGIAVLFFIIGGLVILLLIQRAKQKELRFLQEQQKTNEEIYQLIQNQQTKIDEARQIEKKRIAQDLHDGIMNRLSSTRLNLHILNENATAEIIKKCLPFIAGIQDIEKEIRSISHDLNKDAIFNKVSFVAVMETFIEEQKPFFAGKCHLEIERNINWEWLSTFQKIHIFRMLQEAFQNIVKHAQAKNIIISILKNENQLLLEIFDDGVGFSLKQKKKGIGLQNIFSRAKQCRGKAEINSEVGTGTTIRITIPLSPKL